MENQRTTFTPFWARNAVMDVILGKYRDPDHFGLSQSDIIDECISSVISFDDLSEDIQHWIFDLLLEAVYVLLEEDILLVDDVIFDINPELLSGKGDRMVSPYSGNA